MHIQQQDQAAYAALVLRLALGVMFLAHGLLKLVVFTPAGTAGFFESIGLPGFLGHLTLWGEIIGGLLLIAGIGSRWVAAALIPVLIGSIAFAHWDAGWLFTNAGGGWEYPAFLIAASIAQVLLGDGAYALRNIRRPIGAQTQA
ncbi:MAG: DoxX family protein [Ectothiorhodospiraceae bacterium]|nr:DoxX family protein [Ectothiorhodospiraceae bacterium]MCH8504899.1 DoxX family protein [Ectothiorhodospiraceae bacterium]